MSVASGVRRKCSRGVGFITSHSLKCQIFLCNKNVSMIRNNIKQAATQFTETLSSNCKLIFKPLFDISLLIICSREGV